MEWKKIIGYGCGRRTRTDGKLERVPASPAFSHQAFLRSHQRVKTGLLE